MSKPLKPIIQNRLPEGAELGLDQIVARMRLGNESWSQIAFAIHEITGITVSPETVRGWYPALQTQSIIRSSAA